MPALLPPFTLLIFLLAGGHGGPTPTPLGREISGEEWVLAVGGFQQPQLYPPAPLFEGEELFLADLEQLTFGGQNAEAYWSPDGSKLLFQSTRDGGGADQIFTYDLATGQSVLVSTGLGVTTCPFWLSDGKRFIYASTHEEMAEDPPPLDYSQGYVWPIHGTYEIYLAAADTGEIIEKLTDVPGYDAEVEGVDWNRNNRMVFTSARDGDLELYGMTIDGDRRIVRLTHSPGYDGGSFPGYSGEVIVWRRSIAKTEEEKTVFQDLFDKELVRPSALEIWAMRPDGTLRTPLTDNGAANFGPVLSPNDQFVLYVSNEDDPQGRGFDLFMLPLGQGKTQKVTQYPGFDGFPMFSPDGEWIVFGSNRNGLVEGETNLFVARWVGPSAH
ncbi:PD40 domain-containing protein [bacterium]|nr:PD40 domain-containing protein [bacterium]